MPFDLPALSTPPTDPAPSNLPPPAPEYESVWRHTFLAQFTNPADGEALRRFGRLLYTATLSAGYVGDRDRQVAADGFDAVTDGLDALAAALREISEVPDHLVLGPENQNPCREARDWEGRVSDLAHEIRCRLREEQGNPVRDTDRRLTDDIREPPAGPFIRPKSARTRAPRTAPTILIRQDLT